jgi:hypothetical protein
VRKSINFCRTINLDSVGLVENMGPFECPCCGKQLTLFKSGGGETTAEKMGIPFLGTLPFDQNVVKTCDAGKAIDLKTSAPAFMAALADVVDKIIKSVDSR